MADQRNFMTRKGADKLCRRIEAYWKRRGFKGIETRLESQVTDLENCDRKELFFVRSNIGPHGFPPRMASRKAA